MNKARVTVGLLVAACVAGMVYTGYIGGRVFAEFTPKVSPPPALKGIGAVLVSGDMGFSVGMGRDIAARLRRDGIPVLAVNSLAYFRHRRSSADDQILVAGAVHRGLALPGISKLVLIGQSFGADMLQAGLPGLTPPLRSHVMSVVLVVPGDTVEYRASPSNLFDWGEPSLPALPTARGLNWVPALCIRGAEETDSLCPLLTQPNMHSVVLPGGHPLHRDVDRVYGVVFRSIVDAARASAGDVPANRISPSARS